MDGDGLMEGGGHSAFASPSHLIHQADREIGWSSVSPLPATFELDQGGSGKEGLWGAWTYDVCTGRVCHGEEGLSGWLCENAGKRGGVNRDGLKGGPQVLWIWGVKVAFPCLLQAGELSFFLLININNLTKIKYISVGQSRDR